MEPLRNRPVHQSELRGILKLAFTRQSHGHLRQGQIPPLHIYVLPQTIGMSGTRLIWERHQLMVPSCKRNFRSTATALGRSVMTRSEGGSSCWIIADLPEMNPNETYETSEEIMENYHFLECKSEVQH